MRTSPTGDNINYNDYTFEGDGHLYAFQEAFHDLIQIDGMLAVMNTHGVNVFSEAYRKGGMAATQEAIENLRNSVVLEGFFGNMKARLVSLLKKLKEKIKAFFHSAIQYFDAFFKSDKAFAEKYEDELRKKDSEGKLQGFKYEMYTYKKLDGGISNINGFWERMKSIAIKKARHEHVDLAIKESYGMNCNVSWIDALLVLTESSKNKKKNDDQDVKSSSEEKPGGSPGAKRDQYYNPDQSRADQSNLHYYDDDDERTAYSHNDDDDDDDDDLPDEYWVVNKDKESDDKESDDDLPPEQLEAKRITKAQRRAIRQFCIWEIGRFSDTGEGAFDTQVKKSLRDGKTSPKDIEPNIGDMIDTLKNSNKQLGDIKDIMNTFQNDFDEEIDIVNGMDKSDNNNAIRIRNHVEVFTIAKNVFMEYFNLVKDVMIERNNTYKRCLSAALHYNAK